MSIADDLIAWCGRPFDVRGRTRDGLAKLMGERRLLEVHDDRVFVAFRLHDDATYVAFQRPIPRTFQESPRLWSGRQQALDALHVWFDKGPLHERYPQLVAAVVASPDDDAPRRVLADALLDEGDPRGRFIALQCSGAAPREAAELEESYGGSWRAELGIDRYKCAFQRGFVERLVVPTHEPMLDAVFEYTPIRTLVLRAAEPPSLMRLFELELRTVREVRFEQGRGAFAMKLLAVHPVGRQLEVLGFDRVLDLEECLPHLCAAEWPTLTRIELLHCAGPATAMMVQETFAQRIAPRVTVIVRP